MRILLALAIILAVAFAVWAGPVPPSGSYPAASASTEIIRTYASPGQANYLYVFPWTADVQVIFLPERSTDLNDTFTVRAGLERVIHREHTGFKVVRPTATAVDLEWGSK